MTSVSKRIARDFWDEGTTLRNPLSIVDGRPLSNTVGSVLDPVMSLRRTVRIPPGTTARLVFSTIVASDPRSKFWTSRTSYRDARAFERTLTLAWTQAQVQLHHLGIGADEAHLFQRLANAVHLFRRSLAADFRRTKRSDFGRDRRCGAQGISGDLPIILARIDNEEDVELIRQLLARARILAHEAAYRRTWSSSMRKPPSYVQDLQGSLEALVHGSQLRLSPDTAARAGGFFCCGEI